MTSRQCDNHDAQAANLHARAGQTDVLLLLVQAVASFVKCHQLVAMPSGAVLHYLPPDMRAYGTGQTDAAVYMQPAQRLFDPHAPHIQESEIVASPMQSHKMPS
eukprot:scaffold294223_cov18-Prasinocladus_malaysianus.AAC.1